VVATHARVDVSNEFATVGMEMHCCKTLDAARLYSSPSITVNDLAFLAMRLASDRSEGSSPSINPGEALGSPILRTGDRLCFHGLGFVPAIPLK
jgi:hypothetical protein